MTTRTEKLKRAFERYDSYMHYEHVAMFDFIHSEFFQRFVEKPNKKGIVTKSVTDQWVKEVGLHEIVSVTGLFRGTEIDLIIETIKQDLDKQGRLFDCTLVEEGLQKTTKIDCVRKDKPPTKLPSLMTDKELSSTWLNPDWTPYS